MIDVVCIGGATRDVFVRSNAAKIMRMRDIETESAMLCFDYGAKVNVEKVEFTTGGGGTNTAVAFSRLGLKSAFLGSLGTDEAGDAVLADMKREGADVSLAGRTDEFSTGFSVVLNSFEGDRTVLTFRGANSRLAREMIPWDQIQKAKWFHISSLSGKSAEVLDELVEFSETHGISLSFNPGATQIKRGVKGLAKCLSMTEILYLNKDEASEMTGIKAVRRSVDETRCALCNTCVDICPKKIVMQDDGRIRVVNEETCIQCGNCIEKCPEKAFNLEPWADNEDEILRAIRALGPKIVVVTDGAKGTQVYDGKTRYLLPAFPAKVIDTLGAGDAYAAGFTAGFIHSNGDVESAMRYGSANGASVVEKFGGKAGLLTREGIEARIRDASASEENLSVRKKDMAL